MPFFTDPATCPICAGVDMTNVIIKLHQELAADDRNCEVFVLPPISTIIAVDAGGDVACDGDRKEQHTRRLGPIA